MRIATLSRYAVRAAFDIAYHGGDQSTPIKEISKRQKISMRYLEQILNKLLKAGLLKSERGPHGGYMLSRLASKITVLDIINAAQGPIVPVACLDEKRRTCEVFPDCVTRHVWKTTQSMLVEYFASVTIADLCTLAHEQGLSRELGQEFVYEI